MRSTLKPNSLSRLLIKTTIVVAIMVVGCLAVSVEYVGSINDGLFAPTSLTVGDGQLAVLEPYAHQLKVYSADGLMRHEVNLTGDASGLQQIGEDRYLFCDRERKQIIEIDLTFDTQRDFLPGTGTFTDPVDICVTANRILVLDAGSNDVVIFDRAGTLQKRFDIVDDNSQTIRSATSLACDELHGMVYVLDQISSTIHVYNLTGQHKNSFGSYGAADAQITRGGKIICGQDQLIFVSDRYQSRIAVFSSDGEFVVNIDLTNNANYNLAIPTGLAIDRTGLLYVASTESAMIHIFHVQKQAGSAGSYYVSQVYPQPFDTVAVTATKLIAEVESTGDLGVATGVDFELYLDGDLNHAVEFAVNRPVTPHSDDNTRAVVSEWLIGETLAGETMYQWRVRPRTEENIGDWSAFRAFYTASLPHTFHLEQNYPNPFNPETLIGFSLPSTTHVDLIIHNLMGQQVRSLKSETYPAGHHQVVWDGATDAGVKAASGVYFYRLTAGKLSQTRKMVLLK